MLLLDEAFSNMDISHTLRLLDIIKTDVKENNRTVISVFHDINLAAAWSDKLIFVKQGKIAAFGSTRQVMTQSVIRDVFQVDSTVEFNQYANANQAYFRADHSPVRDN